MNKGYIYNIPKQSQPMDEKDVYAKFYQHDYRILKYTYKNNLTKIDCLDNEGYIVKVCLGSLGRIKNYQRFSTTCNEDNFIYNANLFAEKTYCPSRIKSWMPSTIKNHINVNCLCSCGNEFITDFNQWRRNEKVICNRCSKSTSNYEITVKKWLDSNIVEYTQQYRFKDCRNKKPLPFDFYLPKYNMCIEVDGEQHFSHIHFIKSGKNSYANYLQCLRHDKIKTEYCANNNITLIRIPYYDINNGIYIHNLQNMLNIY